MAYLEQLPPKFCQLLLALENLVETACIGSKQCSR